MSEPQSIAQLLRQQLGSRCQEVALAPGDPLFHQGEPADAVYLVLDGRLRVSQVAADGAELALGEMGPGGIVGELGLLAAGRRTASVAALEAARLLCIGQAELRELLEASPAAAAALAELASRRLHRSQLAAALRQLLGSLEPEVLADIEAAVAWVPLRGGEVLVRKGEADRSLYILLSGRLQVRSADDAALNALPTPHSEVAPGESVGEIALLTGEPRTGEVRALRDSVLAKLSLEAFESISTRHPRVLAALARVLIRRLRARERPSVAPRRGLVLAVVPAGPRAPVGGVAARLAEALARLGPALLLSRESIARLTGLPDAAGIEPSAPRGSWLAAWLGEQEARHAFIVFQADAADSAWTQRCARQADRVLLLARAEDAPGASGPESAIGNWKSEIPHAPILVLSHRAGTALPSGTAAWLDALHPSEHYHIREGDAGDMARLARCLARRAVGLALGGGGARGLAHLGVVRALRECGVPIDRVAGTSMGAIVAAATAMEMDYAAELAHGHRTFIEGRPHKEYTLPLFSLIRGRRLDRHLALIYGDARIEDLWRPFACVSCNLTATGMAVHDRGLVWKAVRASLAIPGIFTPAVERGQLLVDGGILNNLPGDLLRGAGCSRVIAVDVSPSLDLAMPGEEFPSPWRHFWRRLRRKRATPRVPSIVDILMRSVVISSDERVAAIKRDADLCLAPPVTHYGMLQFEAMHAIAEAGYAYAIELLRGPSRPPWLDEFLA